ncbi:MAG: ferritin-like domain-containing protein [Polyangiales bacterium]
MDFKAWQRRLAANREDVVDLPRSSTLDPARRAAVAQLLGQYAGGEEAEREIAGAILAGARDPDDRAALALLLDDERRHAEMLKDAVACLGFTPPVNNRRDLRRMIHLVRPLSFVELVMMFHVMEIAVSTAYRVLRAANRHDPMLRAVLGAIVRDEVVHKAFHEERLAEAVRELGRLRRAKLRVIHVVVRHLLLTGPYHVVPHAVYETAMGISFAQFKGHLRRAYERAYSGELAWLRG